jgi:excisionase family DNA binding protein
MSLRAREPDETFLTVAEVAGMLKLNQQTVRNWIDQGSLPALRVGRRVRIRRSDLDRVLAQGYTGVATSHKEASGPTADDFWAGDAVGLTEPAPHSDPGGSAEPPPRPGEE